MPRAIFIVYPETGHYFSFFGLAEDLQAQGFEILFVGTADFEQLVSSQRFEFRSVLTDLFPAGQARNRPHLAPTDLGAWVKGLKQELLKLESLCDKILDGQVTQMISEARPDLVLIDSMLAFLGLSLTAAQIPCGLITTTLPRVADSQVPPLGSGLVPRSGLASALRTRIEWSRTLWANRCRARLLSFLNMSPIRLIEKTTKVLAAQAGITDAFIRYDVEFGSPMPPLPEFVLCCEEFEFPRAPLGNRYYIGPCIYHSRVSPPEIALRQWLDKSKLLIYCSLGTQTHEYRDAKLFFRNVIAACERRSGCQLVVAAGNCDASELGTPSKRLFIAKWAPQLEILARAGIAITNGSFNTVKECIWSGVPMLLLPTTRDHPGCAARAVHHGVGLRFTDSGVDTISRLIDQASTSKLRSRAAALQRSFRLAQDNHSTLRRSIYQICQQKTENTQYRRKGAT